MRILLAGKQHYDPGGVPASSDQLAHRLGLAGHDVVAFAHAPYRRPVGPEAQRRTIRREAGRGYEAWSVDLLAPEVGLEVVIRRFRPDVVVVNAGGSWWHDWTEALLRAAPGHLPLVLYIRDAEALPLLDADWMRADLVLVNSEHLAAGAAARQVCAPVVPSVIEPELYRVDPSGEAVVFINPVATKGLETALAIAAARPDVPFEFRQSWYLADGYIAEIERRARPSGNVTIHAPSDDPAEAYRRARLLLVPYDDEGRPRVVGEAHASAIPVLARDRPALREVVGPGGILVPPDAPLDRWLEALDVLWSDQTAHRHYAEAALAHSRRPEVDPDGTAARFVELLAELVTSPRFAHRGQPEPAAGDGEPEAAEGEPLASVVVPVLNAASTIDAQLAALAAQTYRGPWELIVADNGSRDGTQARVETWRDRLPSVRIVDASARRGVAHARNVGLRAAAGDVLLICDGDDVVEPGWLAHIVAALDGHPIVTGAVELETMNDPDQYAWMGPPSAAAPVAYHYLPYAPGGNIGMWREVYELLAGFDERLRRAEDIDFGWRAAYLGMHVHLEPLAVLHHRLRSSTRSVFTSAVRGGMAEVGLYRRHRARGMPPSSDGRAVWRWLARNLPAAAAGRDRHRWAHHAGKRIGRLLGSARERVLYL